MHSSGSLDGASGAAAPGSRRSHRRRRRCNGRRRRRRRLHLLLLPQRPLRRESYITRGQSLLGNVVPSGMLLKGERTGQKAAAGRVGARGRLSSAWLPSLGLRREAGVRTQGSREPVVDSLMNAWGGRGQVLVHAFFFCPPLPASSLRLWLYSLLFLRPAFATEAGFRLPAVLLLQHPQCWDYSPDTPSPEPGKPFLL